MNNYKINDVVWVQTGLAGTHEEPATILKLNATPEAQEEENRDQSDFVLVTYNVSRYNEIVPLTRIRKIDHSFKSEQDGPRRSSRRTRKPESMSFRCGDDSENGGGIIDEVVEMQRAGIDSSIIAKDPHVNSESVNMNFCLPCEEEKKDEDECITTKEKSPENQNALFNKNNEKLPSSTQIMNDNSKKQPGKKRKKSDTSPNAPSTRKLRMSTQKQTTSESTTKKKRKKNNPTTSTNSSRIVSNNLIVDADADADAVQPGMPDGNGGLDQGYPYCVEYSKTSRATCKRCNERISKGLLRVGYRPNFRGKPGYTVYKHLQCIVFSEEISGIQDIGGLDVVSEEDKTKIEQRIEESRIEIAREKESLDPEELVPLTFDGEIREKPKNLTANLLPFQVEGVSWMYHQEIHSEGVRGGILADEMGMGKTLQAITLILDNKPKLQWSIPGAKYPTCIPVEKKELIDEEALWDQALRDWNHEMIKSDVPKSILPKQQDNKGCGGGARAGTLVVCPLIAITQWKNEIEKFTENNSLKVCVYHGSDRARNMPMDTLRKYDVVLTTYQVLQADWRKTVSPNRVKCPNCGSSFKIDKLRVHLKYFCGEGAQRTEAQARQVRNSERASAGRSHHSSPDSDDSDNEDNNADSKERPTFSDQRKVRDKDKNKKKNTKISRKSSKKISKKSEAKKKSFKSKKKQDSDDSEFSDPGTPPGSDDSDYVQEIDDESKDSMVKFALSKQRKALKRAKSGKKLSRKSFKKTSKKNEIKKKSFKKEYDSDNEFDSSDSDEPDDGIGGIDMDKLIRQAMAGAKMSILHSLCWFRIVLDESHVIKTRSSSTAQAAFSLIGVNRWCLTGTPLQNRVGEFYSLVRFLRLDPMAHYMCRKEGCDCKQIHYRMSNGKCKDCGHGSVQHYSYFNKHILNPIQRDGYNHDGRRAMFVLKNEVLDKCLLRRTKETKAEDMNLPPRIVSLKSVKLHPVEEDFYNALYTKTQSSFNDYVEGGTLLNNYAHIFDLLMRMRQAVSHPYLVLYSSKEGGQASTGSTTNGSIVCDLCHEPPTERLISTCCQQAFCRNCVVNYMETSAGLSNAENGIQCPSCRRPFSIDLNQVQDSETTCANAMKEQVSTVGVPVLKHLKHISQGSILRRIDLAKFATSSKIEALTQELVQMRKESPGSKAIVFSQFVNMLDLIRWRIHSDPFLADMGLEARALHGGMDLKSRDTVLNDFKQNSNVRVLLMSLKAGGVALNLTVANHIYLMDPWWNPAAEMQAIDRTHRLGQYRPIRAIRFYAEDTVEERILQLQEKKRLLFDGTVGRDAGSLQMLTVDDMKSLFA